MSRRRGLTPAQLDRACGVLLASAVGDALGAGYEFGSARFDGTPAMIGGGLGGFAPGEWTDDTAQALAIARVAATGADLRSEEALTEIAQGFADWYAGDPPDVGTQTGRVLRLAGRTPTGASMAAAARQVHEETGRSAGNGSLMRTGPVALAHLDDPVALVEAAQAVSALTHHDPMAGEACALWCLAIRHAVLSGEMPSAEEVVAAGVSARGFEARSIRTSTSGGVARSSTSGVDWVGSLREAEQREPGVFHQNAWVGGALQAAWSAIHHTPVPEVMPCRQLRDAFATAIGIGHDTDTVAAIAGQLLGARWGGSAIPQAWQQVVHGWRVDKSDRHGAARLVELAILTVRGGRAAADGWPGCERVDYSAYATAGTLVRHPLVDGVWLGGALALDRLPDEVDAVVSLCRVGTRQVPDGVTGHVVRLLDTEPDENPNVDFVIDDAARTVLRLRDQGHRVLLHCVAAQSRTPTVAARVAVLEGTPLERALPAVVAALPGAAPRRFLVESLHRLSAAEEAT